MAPKAEQTIISELIELRAKAYAPYSKFHVACIIQSETGEYHYGCNVENASYSLAQCAEGTAITQMVVAGFKQIKQVWILASNDVVCAPCGACRQKILEFAKGEVPVHLCDNEKIVRTHTVESLLPDSFSRAQLLRGENECS